MVEPFTYYVAGAVIPLLGLLYAALRKPPPPVGVLILVWCGAFIITGLGPASWIGTVLALIGIPIVGAVRHRWPEMRRSICCGAVFAVLIGGSLADCGYVRWVKYEPRRKAIVAAKAAYPLVARSERLPQPAPVALPQPGPHPGGGGWEQKVGDVDDDDWRHLRGLENLDKMHAGWSGYFTRQRHFGVWRMSGMWKLLPDPPEDRPPTPTFPQPAGRPLWEIERDREDAPDLAAALADWHADRGVDLANAPGFGALAPGEPIPDPPDGGPEQEMMLRGFEPHAARTPPGDPLAPDWRLAAVELIGLVRFDEPVAYTSAELPRMGEDVPHHTRTLTEFERSALPRLAAGEWVVAGREDESLRAVGALPAARDCAACHGVEKGRLLGALSYEFVRP